MEKKETNSELYARLKANMEKIGLTVDGNTITKSKFKKLADVHTYIGYPRSNKKFIIFFGLPKENLFGFYPSEGHTKAAALDWAYNIYVEFVTHKMIDEVLPICYNWQEIQWGNSGYPISYNNIRQI